MSERYWTFVCKNNNRKKTWIERYFGFKDEATYAIIFGSEKYGFFEDQPNKGIKVYCSEQLHGMVRAEVSQKPVSIFIKSCFTKTLSQLINQLIFIRRETADSIVQNIFRPTLFLKFNQSIGNGVFLSDNEYKIDVDKFTEIAIPLLPKEQVTIICRVEQLIAK